jgi:hypothetical protein
LLKTKNILTALIYAVALLIILISPLNGWLKYTSSFFIGVLTQWAVNKVRNSSIKG